MNRRIVNTRGLDATFIVEGIFQGSFPVNGEAPARAGFDVLVLCAKEKQPPVEDFPGVRVLRCPLEDDGSPMTPDEWRRAVICAYRIAAMHDIGANILITCAQGLNRSGLVTALTVSVLTGNPTSVTALYVQDRRSGALVNKYFMKALMAQ